MLSELDLASDEEVSEEELSEDDSVEDDMSREYRRTLQMKLAKIKGQAGHKLAADKKITFYCRVKAKKAIATIKGNSYQI